MSQQSATDAAGAAGPPPSSAAHVVFKFIIIGPTAVGKSSILLQFTEHFFHGEHETTVGVEFGTYLCELDAQRVKLQIWDTAGQESFRAITRAYYRGAHGVLLVYDVTRRETFTHLSSWLEEARANGERHASWLLIGNKCDLAEARQASTDEGRAFAEAHGLSFLEASAKTAFNVEEAFVKLARSVFHKYKRGPVQPVDAQRSSLAVHGPDAQQTPTKGCCD